MAGSAHPLPKPVLEALQGHLNGRNVGYVFEGRDSGHISTRQTQRLLDTIAERAGLQETRKGNEKTKERIKPHLCRCKAEIIAYKRLRAIIN